MKTFVVNLKKSVERMQKIAIRLDAIGVPFERVEAVYGRERPSLEKRQNSSCFWWWCIKGYPMRDGEYGCAMSHLNIYRRMIDENIEIACVLEDDARPRDCLPSLLKYLECSMHVESAQVALIANHRDKKSSLAFSLDPISSGSFTDGYVITLPAARQILCKNFPVRCPSDTWTLWRQKGWIELFQAYPEGVNQEWDTTEGYVSDVTAAGDTIVDVRKMTKAGRALWRLKRLVGMSIVYLFLR